MTRVKIAAGAVAVTAVLIAGGVVGTHMLRERNADVDTNVPAAGAATTPALAQAQPDAVAQLLAAPLAAPDGKPGGLAAFKGQVLVVNFWASWCGPCVREMPALAGLARQYAGKGVQFIGIGVDSEKNVQSFLHKVPVDYPIYVSGFGGADLARHFGNLAGGLPFTVVIDANGAVRSTKLGEISPNELRRTLDAL
ncbi:TlpA family protein disulfide reductase [Trinickia sp. LjRoot230]|uniref:TlpA family protein disulfide reductase n=1 Tax=Trinickia sp. LjRoot230 TaxID=3342288 RepID=UPI003ECFF871